MMGNNEFQAWDEEFNKIYDGTEIENREDLIACLSHGKLRIYKIENGEHTELKPLKVFQKEIKNKNKLIEGDILTAEQYPFQLQGEYNYHGVVEWDDDEVTCFLTLRCVGKGKRGISDYVSSPLMDYDLLEFNAIGNIYENPELLNMN